MKTKITVTRRDIQRGLMQNQRSCPIALALKKRKIPFLSVFDTEITFMIKDEHKSIALPRRAEKFIEAFDEAKKVKPFSFIINLPKYK